MFKIKLSDIRFLSKEEENNLLFGRFNDTRASYPEDATLVSPFEEQAARQGDRVAVKRGERVLTYRELNEEANRLAHAAGAGIGPGRGSGTSLRPDSGDDHCPVGGAESGGADLPVDPTYPEERKSFMLTDGGVRFLLAESRENLPDFAGEVWVSGELDLKGYPRENPHPVNEARDLCYILYTSGSTGQPKGVMVEHRNVVRLLFNDRNRFDFSGEDVWTLFHSPCFDFSVWEIYGALLNGGCLVMVETATTRDPEAFADLLAREGVTVLNQTPTAFYQLAREVKRRPRELSVRQVIFGGRLWPRCSWQVGRSSIQTAV